MSNANSSTGPCIQLSSASINIFNPQSIAFLHISSNLLLTLFHSSNSLSLKSCLASSCSSNSNLANPVTLILMNGICFLFFANCIVLINSAVVASNSVSVFLLHHNLKLRQHHIEIFFVLKYSLHLVFLRHKID